MGERSLRKSGDISVTASGVVRMEINLPEFRTSAAMPHGMAEMREEKTHFSVA